MSEYKIVITSIFEPSEAVKLFASLSDFDLIVVGDKKTPAGWHCSNVKFISVAAQDELGFELTRVLPYNHYCRKMLGYLLAIKEGAAFIVDTDDDNLPKSDWSFPSFDGSFDTIKSDLGFVNVYQLFTSQFIWPRGLPLRLISKRFELENAIAPETIKVGVWQGLADEDPDVDAIYRLTFDQPCYFNERSPFVLSTHTLSPFNSQNTMIRKELFCLLYLPTYVTFRYTDILRSLVAQPIMWLYGYHLGFLNATVVQKRNPHNYHTDFVSEIPMYETVDKVIELVSSVIRPDISIEENLWNAYTILLKEGIVEQRELETLRAWLNDLTTIVNE